MIDTLDIFAGPGGWSTAAAALGLREAGIELDPWACATRAAAGHLTVRADASRFSLARVRGVRGLIGSPPCGTFSAAGKGEGVDDLPLLHQALDDLAAGRDTRAALAAACSDPRTPLVVEPLRYALALRPEWIALEQVPAVLPLWRHIARILRAIGYSAWAGVLNAADYGVPQTRQRAILIASRVRTAAPPPPTHAKVAEPDTLFGPGRARWVSMAQALGWGATGRPVPTVTAGGGNTGGAEPFPTRARELLAAERDRGAWVVRTNSGNGYAHDYERDLDEPSPALTSRANRWRVDVGAGGFADGYTRAIDDPSPTIREQTKSWVLRSGQSVAGDGRAERDMDEPAVSITGRADLCSWRLRNNTQANAASRPMDQPAGTLFFGHPGNVVAVVPEEQGSGAVEPVRITVQEAAVLQSFPPDYPFQGTKTAKFRQVGDAVPPLLALHVLSAASGIALSTPDALERAA